MPERRITYVALLRGVNVGGNTMVSMAALKKCCEALGFEQVRTYINSGNVIFKSPSKKPRELETRIERALTATFRHNIKVVVRSCAEMKALIERMPRTWQTPLDERRYVIFLRHTIDNPTALELFVPKPGIERLEYQPGVLFWSAKISDLAQSNMTKAVGLPLYKEMTVRNMNTTRKLFELMQEADRNP
jgi:uncharacterized protein (DUF1697 family)